MINPPLLWTSCLATSDPRRKDLTFLCADRRHHWKGLVANKGQSMTPTLIPDEVSYQRKTRRETLASTPKRLSYEITRLWGSCMSSASAGCCLPLMSNQAQAPECSPEKEKFIPIFYKKIFPKVNSRNTSHDRWNSAEEDLGLRSAVWPGPKTRKPPCFGQK